MKLMRFKELYKTAIVPALKSKYTNVMEIPRLDKICLNMGVGEAALDSKVINHAVGDLSAIAGQKAVITKSHKSNASFKIREGMAIGCRVTLRKDRMYEMLERLVLVALPRLKDFKAFTMQSFDGNGNISFGIKEQIVFPEIRYDKVDQVRGLDVTIVTTAKTDEQARELLSGFFLPFKDYKFES